MKEEKTNLFTWTIYLNCLSRKISMPGVWMQNCCEGYSLLQCRKYAFHNFCGVLTKCSCVTKFTQICKATENVRAVWISSVYWNSLVLSVPLILQYKNEEKTFSFFGILRSYVEDWKFKTWLGKNVIWKMKQTNLCCLGIQNRKFMEG